MTGPEHYQAAEQLLAEGRVVVAKIRVVTGPYPERLERRDDLGKKVMGIWAQAQAHATLALAAATVDATGASENSRLGWHKVSR